MKFTLGHFALAATIAAFITHDLLSPSARQERTDGQSRAQQLLDQFVGLPAPKTYKFLDLRPTEIRIDGSPHQVEAALVEEEISGQRTLLKRINADSYTYIAPGDTITFKASKLTTHAYLLDGDGVILGVHLTPQRIR